MRENRRANRFDIIGVAHITRPASALPLEAQIVNISQSGIRIYTTEPLSGQVEMSLHYFADGRKSQIDETLKGRVAWTQEKASWYSIGIDFIDLNPHDHPATSAFLEEYNQVADNP